MISLLRTFAFVLISTLLAATSAMAADLAEYQERVRTARAGVQSLQSNLATEEAGDEPDQPTAAIFAEVRGLIPNTETIQTGNGSIETNNQWLADRLKAAEAETDLTKRAEILQEIEGRLAVLGVRLQELEQAVAAERSKDEDKRKLSEILSRPEYQKPAKQDAAEEESVLSKWLKQFLEWLESLFPKGEGGGSSVNLSGAANVAQYVLIGAIILLLGFLAYKLIPLFAPRFRRGEKKESESRVILGETIDDDVSASDLFSDAERLAREGDLRGAIRKGYVALLCEMSDRKLIGLARHKTNRDYLRDVRSRREIHQQMTGITGSFERHWYGSQDAERDDWDEFRRRCRETIKAI